MINRVILSYLLRKASPFDVLGLSGNESKDEIKAKYKQLALKYHPDRNKSPEAASKMKEVNKAYEAISSGKVKPNSSSGKNTDVSVGSDYSMNPEDEWDQYTSRRCKHGTPIGHADGPDYMCNACEDGLCEHFKKIYPYAGEFNEGCEECGKEPKDPATNERHCPSCGYLNERSNCKHTEEEKRKQYLEQYPDSYREHFPHHYYNNGGHDRDSKIRQNNEKILSELRKEFNEWFGKPEVAEYFKNHKDMQDQALRDLIKFRIRNMEPVPEVPGREGLQKKWKQPDYMDFQKEMINKLHKEFAQKIKAAK